MNILEEAGNIVDGPRQANYGHPIENHGCTAEMWTSYLRRRGLLAEDAELDAHDVCILNILQKTSRDANSRQRDNLVDIAGFARNAEMVGEPATPQYVIDTLTRTPFVESIVRALDADMATCGPGEKREIRVPRDWGNHNIITLLGVPVVVDKEMAPGTFEIRRHLGFVWVTTWTGVVE